MRSATVRDSFLGPGRAPTGSDQSHDEKSGELTSFFLGGVVLPEMNRRPRDW